MFVMLIVMFGLNIASIQLTKDIHSSGGYLTGPTDQALATHQAAQVHDFDTIISTPISVDDIEGMDMITVETPNGKGSYRIESWEVSAHDTFHIETTGNHTLAFNGSALTWDEAIISETEEVPETRTLHGWRDKLARKVKKKLDSPMCNTEALVDKFGRRLDFAMAPACHVGVSGAKIYMHYTSS